MKKEEEILKKLADCWNEFAELKQQHPSETDDFLNGIHKCQYVLGMRFTRDSKPDLFPLKDELNNKVVNRKQINENKENYNCKSCLCFFSFLALVSFCERK